MSISVAIVGASGYAGGEIIRLLLNHPAYHTGELSIGALTAGSSAGSPLPQHLGPLSGYIIQETDTETLAQHDVVFLGLPHGHSARIAKEIEKINPSTIIIDCAADFRLRSQEDWDTFYDGPYAGSWPYGIPEMPGHRDQLRGAQRIAVPGCFPTGATLALMPAVSANIVEPEITVVSVTGLSGAGKKAQTAMLGSETIGSVRAYKVGGTHRHNPEIVQNLKELNDQDYHLSFTPVLAPMTRGILTTASAPLKENLSAEQVQNIYEEFYANEHFIRVLEQGEQPETHNITGSNMCHIAITVDAQAQRLVIISAIDNLTKGTAGAAVQCMNLALGWEETLGLPLTGLAP